MQNTSLPSQIHTPHVRSNSVAALWRQLHETGDPGARSELISQYHFLVRTTVARIGRSLQAYYDRDDLIGMGTVGLIRAVDQYCCNRNAQFETYAITLIRGAILETVRSSDWMPRSVRVVQKRIRQATIELTAALQREPADAELARHLCVGVEEVHRALEAARRNTIMSLDELTAEGDDENLRRFEVAADAAQAPGAAVEERERTRELARAVSAIPSREKQVIDLYYRRQRTFREIGTALGISEVRAHQLHGQALHRLRRGLHAQSALFA